MENWLHNLLPTSARKAIYLLMQNGANPMISSDPSGKYNQLKLLQQKNFGKVVDKIISDWHTKKWPKEFADMKSKLRKSCASFTGS